MWAVTWVGDGIIKITLLLVFNPDRTDRAIELGGNFVIVHLKGCDWCFDIEVDGTCCN